MNVRNLLAVLAVSVAACIPSAQADMKNKPAPDFALRSLDGQNRRLSEMRGEVVMINFWATWCGPCREEMPLLDRIYQQYHPVGFEVLGVNVDDAGSTRAVEMAKNLGVSFPVLFDEAKSVSRLYGIDTMPMTVLIARDGTVRYLHQGYQPGAEQGYMDQIRQLLKD